ncbi:MAG TPA: phosphohistidine phosphatase SixA [Candidatus Angelobacter sp.]|nr:phosphohistidine phosphatase SixA [Candidatus Angelobacter sp.]
MIVYFLRHASAGKKLHSATKDERRPLDDEGILQTRYVGRMLANLDVQVEHIVSSPLKRALQTASLVANEMAFERPVVIDEALRPESTFVQIREMLSRFKQSDSVIVVGHNPNFTEFVSKIISGAEGTAQVEMKKGSVAKIELNGRSGTLQWLVTPRIARSLQSSLKSSSRPKTSRK